MLPAPRTSWGYPALCRVEVLVRVACCYIPLGSVSSSVFAKCCSRGVPELVPAVGGDVGGTDVAQLAQNRAVEAHEHVDRGRISCG